MKKSRATKSIRRKANVATLIGWRRNRLWLGWLLVSIFVLNGMDPSSALGEGEVIIFKPDYHKNITDTERTDRIPSIEEQVHASIINNSGRHIGLTKEVSEGAIYPVNGHPKVQYYITGLWFAKKTYNERRLMLRLKLFEWSDKAGEKEKGRWNLSAKYSPKQLQEQVIPAINDEIAKYVFFKPAQDVGVTDTERTDRIPNIDANVRASLNNSGLHFYFPNKKVSEKSFVYVGNHPNLQYFIAGLWFAKETNNERRLMLRLKLFERSDKAGNKEIGRWILSAKNYPEELRDRVIPEIKDKLGIKRPKRVYAHCVFFKTFKWMKPAAKVDRFQSLQYGLTFDYPKKLEEQYPTRIRINYKKKDDPLPEYNIVYQIGHSSYEHKCTNKSNSVPDEDVERVDYVVEGRLIWDGEKLLITWKWKVKDKTYEKGDVKERSRCIPISSISDDEVVNEMGRKLNEIIDTITIDTNTYENCEAV